MLLLLLLLRRCPLLLDPPGRFRAVQPRGRGSTGGPGTKLTVICEELPGVVEAPLVEELPSEAEAEDSFGGPLGAKLLVPLRGAKDVVEGVVGESFCGRPDFRPLLPRQRRRERGRLAGHVEADEAAVVVGALLARERRYVTRALEAAKEPPLSRLRALFVRAPAEQGRQIVVRARLDAAKVAEIEHPGNRIGGVGGTASAVLAEESQGLGEPRVEEGAGQGVHKQDDDGDVALLDALDPYAPSPRTLAVFASPWSQRLPQQLWARDVTHVDVWEACLRGRLRILGALDNEGLLPVEERRPVQRVEGYLAASGASEEGRAERGGASEVKRGERSEDG